MDDDSDTLYPSNGNAASSLADNIHWCLGKGNLAKVFWKNSPIQFSVFLIPVLLLRFAPWTIAALPSAYQYKARSVHKALF